MKALVCTEGTLTLRELKKPKRQRGEALIRVRRAGICSTDLEIVKGYVPGFSGILGHEFFGSIEEADDANLVGMRATAEINCACGKCDYCKKNLRRHCPHRTVLGITGKKGAFAEYVSVPQDNVVVLPDEIPESSAVLIEPLAAALEILEQLPMQPDKPVTEAKSFASLEAFRPVLLVGDGRLAQLIGCVLLACGIPLSVVGKHSVKLGFLKQRGARTFRLADFKPSPSDIVIEASGNPSGIDLALACVKPRGTIVLKSTYAQKIQFNTSSVVVNEITILGSRCGRFSEAIKFLEKFKPDLSYMISARYTFAHALRAFEKAKKPGVLKVLLEME